MIINWAMNSSRATLYVNVVVKLQSHFHLNYFGVYRKVHCLEQHSIQPALCHESASLQHHMGHYVPSHHTPLHTKDSSAHLFPDFRHRQHSLQVWWKNQRKGRSIREQ